MSEKKEFSLPIFLELANYVSPVIKETQETDYVWYGENNLYFQYLLDCYRGSPTNHAVITGISQMIAGDGITSPMAASNVEAYARAKGWFSFEKVSLWAFDLKCYGYYMQVIRLNQQGEISEVDYSPVTNWRSGIADSDGEVDTYFYSDNWELWMANDRRFTPIAYPVYDKDKKVAVSVNPVKPYRSGSFYYPTVDYQSCLQWAKVEEEVSNFHLNNILNGFNPSLIINFNNGDPGEVQRKIIERKLKAKYKGSSRAAKEIISFNEDKDHAVTFDQAPISDLDKQFQFVSEEATKKILLSHRITSPLLFGVRDGSNGLGSNAGEIETSWYFLKTNVLRPYQNLMLDNFEELMNDAGFHIPLEFIEVKPFKEMSEPTGQPTQPAKLSKSTPEMSHENEAALIKFLDSIGQDEDLDNWELIDSRKVDYDLEDQMDTMIMSIDLATTVRSSGSSKSEQDNPLFMTRYAYAPAKVSGDSREFCRKMVSAKKVYSKEDIIKAESQAINPGWGPHGANTYDIWLYKGGGKCQHFWERRLYLKKNNQRISAKQAQDLINKIAPDERFKVRKDRNDPKVAKIPDDMQYHGFLPDNPTWGANGSAYK